uniref:Uncharacterized protein MANES_02G138600 n=1 Tax=Rhizophora mucronata TaxID=61149 RepID=A0A2P2KFW0_RHIMU
MCPSTSYALSAKPFLQKPNRAGPYDLNFGVISKLFICFTKSKAISGSSIETANLAALVKVASFGTTLSITICWKISNPLLISTPEESNLPSSVPLLVEEPAEAHK